MFVLRVPREQNPETEWVASVILGERLGLRYRIEAGLESTLVLEHGQRRLEVANDFLPTFVSALDVGQAMPASNLPCWSPRDSGLDVRLIRPSLPVLFGKPGFRLTPDGNGHLGLDVFGSTFFMLTRLEETLPAPLDEHDRFPARSSVAHKQGFLDRPLIDEYTEIFWAAIKKIWPGLKRSRKQFRVDPSHDVDSPSYYAFRPWRKVLRRAAGDLVKRGQFYVAAKDLFIKIRSATRLHPADPYNTFSWIMDTSEQADLTSTFYFMSGQTNPQFDGDYDLAHPAIRQLIREVRDRGHRVGLHPSYECYRRSDSMLTEANRLREMCIEEQFSVTGLPARMHYLRWETPTTAAKLERAGVTRDCTLTFADHAGFRCGTCHDYQAFDPVRRRSMKIRIQPLIAMETTVLDNRYMGHGVSADAADQFLSLKAACRTVDGVFTLLWHNTQLTSAAQRALYTAVIAG